MFLMTKTGYLIIAIAVIVVLIILFFVSYVMNKKTPVPKGCENLLQENKHCFGCSNKSCQYYKEKKEEK